MVPHQCTVGAPSAQPIPGTHQRMQHATSCPPAHLLQPHWCRPAQAQVVLCLGQPAMSVGGRVAG